MTRREALVEAFWATAFHLAGTVAAVWHSLRHRPEGPA